MSEIEFGIPPYEVVDVVDSLSDANSEHVGWQIRSWQANKIWEDFGVTGEGVMVGVGDTGVSRAHLSGELSGVVNQMTFVGDRNPFDRNSHGSHVLSIIGAKQNDNGMLGYAPDCKMLSGKCLSDRGSGFDSGIEDCIDWLSESGCHIVSLSLGSPTPSTSILNAIKRADARGTIVFAAAGNDGRSNNIDEPANSGDCIPVGAVDSSLRLARFSDRGRELKEKGVVAGGVNVYGCGVRGYVSMSGTSMATPGAAGQAALFLSAELKFYGKITTKGMAAFLRVVKENQVDLGLPGPDPSYGLGAFDVYSAIKKLAADADPEPTEPGPGHQDWETVYESEKIRLQTKP